MDEQHVDDDRDDADERHVADKRDDGDELFHFAAAQYDALEKSRRQPIASESNVLDRSIQRLIESPEFEEANRLIRIGDNIRTIVDRLDRYRDIDDAWRFGLAAKVKRPVRKPPATARWVTAKRNFLEIVVDIRETSTLAAGINDERDVRACLCALERDLRHRQAEYVAFGDKAGRPMDAIKLLKRTLKLARWRVSPTMAILAEKLKLTADEIKERALKNYLPAHACGGVEALPEPTFTYAEVADSCWLGARAIAEKYGLSESALNTKLSRVRARTHAGRDWRKQEDRKKDEPEFVHRLSSVLPILQEMQRPSESDR